MKFIKQCSLVVMYLMTFFIDSVASVYIKNLTASYIPTLHVSLLMLFTLALYHTKTGVILAIFGGLLHDFYFGKIPLFYTVPIVLLVVIGRKVIKKVDVVNFCLFFLLFILLYHVMLYSQAMLFGLSTYFFGDYLVYKVVPTCIVNVAIAIVLYGVVDAFLRKHRRNFKL